MAPDVSRNSAGEMSRRLIHKGARFDLEAVNYAVGGRPISKEIVRHPGAVVILPLLDTPAGRQVVLIRNFRASIAQDLWELPAGTREPGEPPETTAGRELIEETGYESATIKALGRFYTTPGLTDELMYAYVATGLALRHQQLDVGEEITVHPRPVDAVFSMIDRGELQDGKSILCLFWARAQGLI